MYVCMLGGAHTLPFLESQTEESVIVGIRSRQTATAIEGINSSNYSPICAGTRYHVLKGAASRKEVTPTNCYFSC